MLYWLKRHPFPVESRFDHCLVLTYAGWADVLQEQLPSGLHVERFGTADKLGFVAIALVQTRSLRPAGSPAFLGRDFFLSGYRVFCCFQTESGRMLRGLRILRSDTDRWSMVCFGNLLTRYQYRRARVNWQEAGNLLHIDIRTRRQEADLHVQAHLDDHADPLPRDTCFTSVREARRFAGPLPYTFDYEPETHSLVVIQATREDWMPRPVPVVVSCNTFMERAPWNRAELRLVSAFHIRGISYRWERGVLHRLPAVRRTA